MKKIKYYLLILFSIVTVIACVDNNNDELTGDAITGGLLTISDRMKSIAYVVGDGATYTVSGSVFQGNDQTNSIDVYISFTDSKTGETSN